MESELMMRLLAKLRLGIEIETVLGPQIWGSLPQF